MAYFSQIAVNKQANKKTNYSPNREYAIKVNFTINFLIGTKQKLNKIKKKKNSLSIIRNNTGDLSLK